MVLDPKTNPNENLNVTLAFKPVATTLGFLLVTLMMAAYGSGDGAAVEVLYVIRERVGRDERVFFIVVLIQCKEEHRYKPKWVGVSM